MRCNRTGRRGLRDPARTAWAKKYGARFVGSGEPDVFEARLILEGIDTEALTELSSGPHQGVDELRELLDFYVECWNGLVEKRLDCEGVEWERV